MRTRCRVKSDGWDNPGSPRMREEITLAGGLGELEQGWAVGRIVLWLGNIETLGGMGVLILGI